MTATAAERNEPETYVLNTLRGGRDGEPVLAAQWCRPLGATDSSHGSFRRSVRNLFGKGDGLPGMGVLAVTPTRLLLLDSKSNWSGFHIGATLATWDVPVAALKSRRRTAMRDTEDSYVPRTPLTVVTLPDGREVELPRGEMVSRLLRLARTAPH